MKVQDFTIAFERMRVDNLGKQFERRELGMLARKYGIYINSIMWASGLDKLFIKTRLGTKYIYNFRNVPTKEFQVQLLFDNVNTYKKDTLRTIEHAKNILRRFGFNINNIQQ